MVASEQLVERIEAGFDGQDEGLNPSLPDRLKKDRINVRTAIMIRLAASRTFALGDRTGALRAAQNRSGRPFRVDVRQRVIVKAMVSRHHGKQHVRACALRAHLAYLGRDGAGADGADPAFFGQGVHADQDAADLGALARDWSGDRHHFRFIISPEHGDRLHDLPGYVRDVMARVAADLGEPNLQWSGVCHYDTDQPHAHVVVRGRREDGRDLVIPREYIGYGFRARAQEAAQERLGDLSRIDAERRVWRETQAEYFTGLDRRLLASSDETGLVADGVGATDVWAALTRGRLRTLESLGLAARAGRKYRLDEALEARLRQMQTRCDMIRTLNQRKLEGSRDVRLAAKGRLSGRVTKTGCHDEIGLRPYVVIQTPDGVEHYARLSSGDAPVFGTRIVLEIGQSGVARSTNIRAKDWSR